MLRACAADRPVHYLRPPSPALTGLQVSLGLHHALALIGCSCTQAALLQLNAAGEQVTAAVRVLTQVRCTLHTVEVPSEACLSQHFMRLAVTQPTGFGSRPLPFKATHAPLRLPPHTM